MTTRRLTVSVPQPCQEKWQDMQDMKPEFQGRFCQNCQKTVVDFTQMSDAEVVQWLGKENTCGRFRSNQLDRELTAFSAPPKRWAWRAALLGLFAWFNSKTAEAQTVKKEEFTQLASNTVTLSPKTKSQADPISLKGEVLDSATLAPVIGASIYIAGTSTITSSNAQGQFELVIPASMAETKNAAPQVTFSFPGMMPEKKKLNDLATNPSNKILLRPDRRPVKTVTITLGMPTLKSTTPKN